MNSNEPSPKKRIKTVKRPAYHDQYGRWPSGGTMRVVPKDFKHVSRKNRLRVRRMEKLLAMGRTHRAPVSLIRDLMWFYHIPLHMLSVTPEPQAAA